MLSLSQRYDHPLGDDDEHVSATRSNHQATQENMEVVASSWPHIDYVEQIQFDIVGLNIIEGCQSMGSINEKLALSIQVPCHECLVKSTTNINRNIVTITNEESINTPSLLDNLNNNKVLHYYVDFGGMEEHNGGDEEPNQESIDEESQLPYDPYNQ